MSAGHNSAERNGGPTTKGANDDGGDGFRLSDSPSHLLRRAQQCISDQFLKTALADSVTLRQTVLMAAIAEAEGCSQSELVRATGIDRSTLAEMISRMERKGLVLRTAAAGDGRAKSVALSRAGRARLEEAVPAMQAVDEALMGLVPKSRRKSFQDTLTAIVAADAAREAEEIEAVKREKAEAKARKREEKDARRKKKKKKKK
ncbi:MAG: MarR family transcriptional regulator [Hyphomonadaceae bacterium]